MAYHFDTVKLEKGMYSQTGRSFSRVLEELQRHFEERREIAVDVQVQGPETVTVDITVRVSPAGGEDAQTVLQRVRDAVTAWFTGRRLGQSVLTAELGSLVFRTPGVANSILAAPAEDRTVQPGQLPVLGALTVEEMA